MTDRATACRCVAMAIVVTILAQEASAQTAGWLLVTVRLADSQTRGTILMPNHVLLVTAEDDASKVQRFVIGTAGIVEIPLPPGTYRLESERPLTFRGRDYRWSHRVLIAEGMRTAVELNEGNDTTKPVGPIVAPRLLPPPPPAQRPRRHRFMPLVQYGSPQRLTGGVFWLVPTGEGTPSGWDRVHGVALQASAGLGGWRVAGGPFTPGLLYLPADVMVTVTRTTSAPRGAFGNATYIGVEPGITILPLWSHGRTVVLLRSSIGVARRVSGARGGRRTMFTWSLGAQLWVDSN